MKEFISASAARFFVKKHTAPEKEINDIDKAIEAAAKAGHNYIWHYEQLSEAMKVLLTEKGFDFEETFHRNEYQVKITW
jgi:hypothetical protein